MLLRAVLWKEQPLLLFSSKARSHQSAGEEEEHQEKANKVVEVGTMAIAHLIAKNLSAVLVLQIIL